MDLFPCVKSNLKFMHPFLNVYIPDGKYNVTREGFFASAGMFIKLYLDPEKFKKEEYSKWDLSLQVPMCRMLHHLSYQGGLYYGEGCVVWKTLSTQSCKRHERKKASRLISLQLFWTWLHVPWLAKKKEGDSSLVTQNITPGSSFPYFSVIFSVHHLPVSPNPVWLHNVLQKYFYPFCKPRQPMIPQTFLSFFHKQQMSFMLLCYRAGIIELGAM